MSTARLSTPRHRVRQWERLIDKEIQVRSIVILGAAAALATSLTACSSPAKPSAGPTPAATPTATAPTTAPATAPAPSTTASASTTIDPCQLVTQQEASQVTGASFGPGKLEVDSPASRRCIYGAQTHNVYEVIVAQATTVKQAQTEKAQLLAQLGTKLPLTPVPGLADDAQAIRTSLSANGGTLNISALYVLQGTTGFALVDETNSPSFPTTADLVAQATTVLGRLP